MQVSPSASYSMTVRLEIRNRTGMLGKVTSALGRAGADIGAIDIVQMGPETVIRDITFNASDSKHGQQVVDALRHVAGVKVVHVSDRTFLMHLGGKIEVRGKVAVKGRDDLSMVYTPGVARVCMAIHDDPQKVYTLTIKQNCVAVVTDSTAVLGLGDIGPKGAARLGDPRQAPAGESLSVSRAPACRSSGRREALLSPPACAYTRAAWRPVAQGRPHPCEPAK